LKRKVYSSFLDQAVSSHIAFMLIFNLPPQNRNAAFFATRVIVITEA